MRCNLEFPSLSILFVRLLEFIPKRRDNNSTCKQYQTKIIYNKTHLQKHPRIVLSSLFILTILCNQLYEVILNCSMLFHPKMSLCIGQAVLLLRNSQVLQPCETYQILRNYNFSYRTRQIARDLIYLTQQGFAFLMQFQFSIFNWENRLSLALFQARKVETNLTEQREPTWHSPVPGPQGRDWLGRTKRIYLVWYSISLKVETDLVRDGNV